MKQNELIQKGINIIKSCKTIGQLEVAGNFCTRIVNTMKSDYAKNNATKFLEAVISDKYNRIKDNRLDEPEIEWSVK
jgi:hypothetical protein